MVNDNNGGEYERSGKILRVTSKGCLSGIARATETTWDGAILQIRKTGEAKETRYEVDASQLDLKQTVL